MPFTWEQTLDLYENAFGIRPGVGPDTERVQYLRSLHQYASDLPKPAVVGEIGCFRGKSTAVLAAAMHGTSSRVITIDPVFWDGEFTCDDPSPEGRTTYASDLRSVVRRWSLMRVDSMISVIPRTSADAMSLWDGTMMDLILVDGNHSPWAVTKDCEWSEYVKVDGAMIHDDWIASTKQAVQGYFANKPNWELVYESTSGVNETNWAITMLRRNS